MDPLPYLLVAELRMKSTGHISIDLSKLERSPIPYRNGTQMNSTSTQSTDLTKLRTQFPPFYKTTVPIKQILAEEHLFSLHFERRNLISSTGTNPIHKRNAVPIINKRIKKFKSQSRL